MRYERVLVRSLASGMRAGRSAAYAAVIMALGLGWEYIVENEARAWFIIGATGAARMLEGLGERPMRRGGRA